MPKPHLQKEKKKTTKQKQNKTNIYPKLSQGTQFMVMWQPGWETNLDDGHSVCMAWSLRCTPETISSLISYTPTRNEKLKEIRASEGKGM